MLGPLAEIRTWGVDRFCHLEVRYPDLGWLGLDVRPKRGKRR